MWRMQNGLMLQLYNKYIKSTGEINCVELSGISCRKVLIPVFLFLCLLSLSRWVCNARWKLPPWGALDQWVIICAAMTGPHRARFGNFSSTPLNLKLFSSGSNEFMQAKECKAKQFIIFHSAPEQNVQPGLSNHWQEVGFTAVLADVVAECLTHFH